MTVPLSFSQIKEFKRCAYRYNARYNRGIERISTRLAIAEGDFIHRLLRVLYAKENWRDVWASIKDEYMDAALFEEQAEEITGLAERVFGIMERYEAQVYLPHDADLEILHLEEELPVSYRGVEFVIKPDLVIRDRQGNVWLRDHKTTRDFEDDIASRLRYDDQINLYLWGLRERGLNVLGADHNLIRTRLPRKPDVTKKGLLSRQRITTDEQTVRAAVVEYRAQGIEISDEEVADYLATMKMSEFFKRVSTFRADEMLDRMIEEYFDTYLDIRHATERDRWTRTFISRDCPHCPMRDLCLAELQGADIESLMQTTYKLRGQDAPPRLMPEELTDEVA